MSVFAGLNILTWVASSCPTTSCTRPESEEPVIAMAIAGG